MSNRRPCDKDCEHCKYPDCVYDGLDAEDYAQSRELDQKLTQSPATKKRVARRRAYYEANKEKEAARQRAYREANKETGYSKFTDMAMNFSGLVRFCTNELPPDVIVYFFHHTEVTETGKIKAKTVGKMIDSKLTLEGLFSIVLLCEARKEGHRFITQSDGFTTAKSPMGMFEPEIDNDLKMVDTVIREYWGLDPAAGKEEASDEEH